MGLCTSCKKNNRCFKIKVHCLICLLSTASSIWLALGGWPKEFRGKGVRQWWFLDSQLFISCKKQWFFNELSTIIIFSLQRKMFILFYFSQPLNIYFQQAWEHFFRNILKADFFFSRRLGSKLFLSLFLRLKLFISKFFRAPTPLSISNGRSLIRHFLSKCPQVQMSCCTPDWAE